MGRFSDSVKLVLVVVVFALIAYLMGRCERSSDTGTTVTDTVFVDREFTDTVIVTKVTPPKVLTVYLKPNKPKREQLERGTILQGLTINPKGVELITIDTAGFTKVAFYPIAVGSEVLVNDTGAVQVKPVSIKKTRLIRAGKIAIVVGSFVLGAVLL
jgi:hypothetical protein